MLSGVSIGWGIRCKSVLFPAISSFLVNVKAATWKENCNYYNLFPAEISLTSKHKNSILKSEKYAKPQNKTPTDFSTQIGRWYSPIFTKQYTIHITDRQFRAISIHHKTYLLLIYHLGVFHFRTRAVLSKIPAF